MNCVFQFLLILLVSLLGEALAWVLPLPVPAGIYGIVLMFLGLATGIIPLKAVKKAGDFLVEIMPVMFIPAAVGLMDTWAVLSADWLPYVLTALVSTAAVFAAAGRTAQAVIRLDRRREARHE